MIGTIAPSKFAEQVIDVTIDDPCLWSTLSASFVPNNVYIIKDPFLYIDVPAFIPLNTQCGPISYASTGLPSFMLFDNNTMQLSIQTTDVAMAGNYTV